MTGLYANKRLGQNFLQDSYAVKALVEYIRPSACNHMVEIGPGLGALTRQLLPKVLQLDVIEFDVRLADKLKREVCQSSKPNEIGSEKSQMSKLVVHHADAMQFDLHTIHEADTTKLRLVGNLPYNIATALLLHYLQQLNCIKDIHFMFQKEVALRLCARPGERHYGRLSVITQYYCYVEYLCDISAHSFWPAPKVISSFVRLLPRCIGEHEKVDLGQFERVVKLAFSQRRKMIHHNLKKVITAEQLQALSIEPSLRAEQLTVMQFVHLAQALTSKD